MVMGSGASTPAAANILENELAKPPDASDLTPGECLEVTLIVPKDPEADFRRLSCGVEL